MRQKGFVLVTTMVILILMTGLLALIHFQVIASLSTLSNVEGQLYAMSLSESGVEYARALLPRVELDNLLAGPDRLFCFSKVPGWRDPIPLEVARSRPPEEWVIRCDDGLPSDDGVLLLPNGFETAGKGRFFLRVTNDPAEGGDSDGDGVVTVRSMGIVPSARVGAATPGLRNHVAVAEATFRKEYAFLLKGALTVAAESIDLRFEGSRFKLSGGSFPAVSLLPLAGKRVISDALAAIAAEQQQCFTGLGASPSIVDAGAQFEAESEKRQLLTETFWRHFEENLPAFGQVVPEGHPVARGLLLALEGGEIRQSLEGVLVAKGNLKFVGDGSLDGLLIYLGGGRLTLTDRTVIRGAVWMSSFDLSGPGRGQVQLTVSGLARVLFNEESVSLACRFIPVTQLGWRMIFPEMLR